jgi:hypothetical protein
MSRLVQLTCLASRGLAQPLLPQPNIATLRSLRVSGAPFVLSCQLAAGEDIHLRTHSLTPSQGHACSSPHTAPLSNQHK